MDKETAATNEVANNGYLEERPRKKGGVMNTLYPPGPKPGAGGRIKNHCRRFWWCDLLVLVVIVLVIVLPIIYVAIPKKAQHDLNESTLEVTSQVVSNPTPDGLHLRLVSTARSFSKFHPRIEGFRGALSLEGQAPFLYIDIPETKADSEVEIVVDEDLKFPSLESFIAYNQVVMGSEQFKVHLDGKTKLHQKGLSAIDVDYNKVVTMKGLNGLKGLQISDIKFLSGASEILPDGSNMIGNVTIPNPSVIDLQLGDVTMNLAIDDLAIGTALLPNMNLKPGDNIVHMQSKVMPLSIVQKIKDKYRDGIIPLSITGNSSVYNGQNLAYFEAAIRHNLIQVSIDTKPALAAVGIQI